MINNVVYEKKHHYMFVLKELDYLRKQAEYELVNEGLPKYRLQEIKDLITRTIISLIEEGVSYQYEKEASDSRKDIIRVRIDGKNYECRNMDIREILGDRYDEVMGISYEGLTDAEIQNEKENNRETITQGTLKTFLKNFKEMLQDSIGAKSQRPPVVDYVPPAIQVEEKKKDGLAKKIVKKTIGAALIIAASVALILVLKSNTALKERVNDIYIQSKRQIKKTFFEEETTTEEDKFETEECESETFDINSSIDIVK